MGRAGLSGCEGGGTGEESSTREKRMGGLLEGVLCRHVKESKETARVAF